MENAALVGVMHSSGRRGQQLCASARLAEEFTAPRRKTAAGNEFHGEIRRSAIFTRLVNGKDVWMIQLRHGLGLGLKASTNNGRIEQVGKNHLYGHDAAWVTLQSAIYDAHPAARDLLEDGVPGDERIRGRILMILLFTKRGDQASKASTRPFASR